MLRRLQQHHGRLSLRHHDHRPGGPLPSAGRRPPLTLEESGTQTITQHDIALFLQDSWKPQPNITLNYGLRWEAQIQPDLITPTAQLFYAPFIGQTVTNSVGHVRLPG